MYMLHSLRDKLDQNVIVFEAGDGVGGTGYWNRYPGARCDSDSYVNCYTFDKNLLQEWDWSERYPEQDEILRYLEHCAERFDLKPDIQFGNTGPQSPSVLSNMRVSIEQHVEWDHRMHRPHAKNQACNDRGDPAGARRVGRPCRRGRELEPDAWHQFLVHGSQHRREAAPLLALPRPGRRPRVPQEVR